jgi:hypothetical protein
LTRPRARNRVDFEVSLDFDAAGVAAEVGAIQEGAKKGMTRSMATAVDREKWALRKQADKRFRDRRGGASLLIGGEAYPDPRRTASLAPAGVLFAREPWMQAHLEEGGTIRAARGALAIPLPAAEAAGLDYRGTSAGGTKRRYSGTEAARARFGRLFRIDGSAGGVLAVSADAAARGGIPVSEAEKRAGWVGLFTLAKAVRLPGRLSLRKAAEAVVRRVNRMATRMIEQESTRAQRRAARAASRASRGPAAGSRS